MSEKLGRVLVAGELHWPFLTRKNGNKYTVDIGNFNGEDTALLKALAADAGKTKNKFLKTKEGHPAESEYIICQSQSPINNLFWPADENGKAVALTDAELSRVGSGTKVQVRVSAFVTTSSEYGRNIGANLVKAKVIDVVWYGDDDSDMFGEGVVAYREAEPSKGPVDGLLEEVDRDDDLDDDVPFGKEEVA